MLIQNSAQQQLHEKENNNIKKIWNMEVLKALVGFFIGFASSSLVIIGWHLADIRDELKKLNENNKNRQNL